MEDRDAIVRQRITVVTGREAPARLTIFEDTTEFMDIEAGHVLRLGDHEYLVLGHAREGRFGIDDQPKFWVKSAVDLASGERKFLKLVFHETFQSRIGAMTFDCVRSPEKEAAVLMKMAGHPHFMQGAAVLDKAGNVVRVIDPVPGSSLYNHLRRLEMSHEEYYHTRLHQVMRSAIAAIAAIAELHRIGLNHGDIRADHLMVNRQTDAYVWIDFDYDVKNTLYDVYCLGNIVLQAAGKGRHSLYDIQAHPSDYSRLTRSLEKEDMSLMFQHRIANLQKLFPYLSTDLNAILMRFSAKADAPYLDVTSLLSDLESLFPGP